MDPARAPIEYLLTSSNAALESFELVRLNLASNLRKELRQILEDWIQTEVEARLARCILQVKRDQPVPSNESAREVSNALPCSQLALAFGEPPGELPALAVPEDFATPVGSEDPARTDDPIETEPSRQSAPVSVNARKRRARVRRIAEPEAVPPPAPRRAIPHSHLVGSEESNGRRELEHFARCNPSSSYEPFRSDTAHSKSWPDRDAAAHDEHVLLMEHREILIHIPGDDGSASVVVGTTAECRHFLLRAESTADGATETRPRRAIGGRISRST
jgi:hypothetical protein